MGLPNSVKDKPLVAILISLLIGFLLGWFLMGWVIWPVQYTGESTTAELTAPEKEQYVALLADSYKLTGNAKSSRDALAGWNNSDVRMVVANTAASLRGQGQTDEAKRVEDLGAALGLAAPAGPTGPAAPAGPTTAAKPVAPTTPVPAAPFSLTSLIRICIGFIIILGIVAAVVFIVDRQRRKGRTAASRPTVDKPSLKSDTTAPALARFASKYTFGDDSFDESFTIESPTAEFLGECGIGISEVVESGPPDRIAAFEIWLFDKSDIRTVTKVLMSEHAYNDQAIRDKLAPKGDAVMATPGATIPLETASLILQVHIDEMQYGSESQYPNSYFESLAVDLVANPKA